MTKTISLAIATQGFHTTTNEYTADIVGTISTITIIGTVE